MVGACFAYGSIFKSTENPDTSIDTFEVIDKIVEQDGDDITPVEELDARKEEESLLLSIAHTDAVAAKEASLDLANKEKGVLETAISASTEKLVELNKQANAQTTIVDSNTLTLVGLATSLQEANGQLLRLTATAKQTLQALTDANTELTNAKSANTSAQNAWQIQQTKLTGLTMATTKALSAKKWNADQLVNLQGQYNALGRWDGSKKRALTPQIVVLKKKTTSLENAYQRANTAEQHAKGALDILQTEKLQKTKEEKDAQDKFNLATSAKSDADTAQAELETKIMDYTTQKGRIDGRIATAKNTKSELQREIDAENKTKTDVEDKLAVQAKLIATLNTELTELKEKIKTAE